MIKPKLSRNTKFIYCCDVEHLKWSSPYMLKELLTVVIICYDPYKDAIELNPYFLNKYWPHCSIDVLYVTSSVDTDSKYKSYKTNGDLSYSGRLKKALEHVDTPYVLLLLDDYFLSKKVNEEKISENISFMKENNIDFCELYTIFSIPEGSKFKYKNNKYIRISHKRKYRLTLQPAIFSTKLLEKVLEHNPMTPWNVELAFMQEDFKYIEAYYALNKSFSIVNYIDKGLATRKAYTIVKKEGLWKNQRGVTPMFLTIKKGIAHNLYRFIPQKIKDKIKRNDKIFRG